MWATYSSAGGSSSGRRAYKVGWAQCRVGDARHRNGALTLAVVFTLRMVYKLVDEDGDGSITLDGEVDAPAVGRALPEGCRPM